MRLLWGGELTEKIRNEEIQPDRLLESTEKISGEMNLRLSQEMDHS